MTEERLERLGGLKHEADALLMMLDKTLKVGPVMTTDAVASAAGFPYSKHTVVVSGLNLGEYQDDVDNLRRNPVVRSTAARLRSSSRNCPAGFSARSGRRRSKCGQPA